MTCCRGHDLVALTLMKTDCLHCQPKGLENRTYLTTCVVTSLVASAARTRVTLSELLMQPESGQMRVVVCESLDSEAFLVPFVGAASVAPNSFASDRSSFPPRKRISDSQRQFLLDGVQQNLRSDGRGPFDYRRAAWSQRWCDRGRTGVT